MRSGEVDWWTCSKWGVHFQNREGGAEMPPSLTIFFFNRGEVVHISSSVSNSVIFVWMIGMCTTPQSIVQHPTEESDTPLPQNLETSSKVPA